MLFAMAYHLLCMAAKWLKNCHFYCRKEWFFGCFAHGFSNFYVVLYKSIIDIPGMPKKREAYLGGIIHEEIV